jgi:2,5-diamino-6-(ribosylamino)-4(3H)-pyrimidinone 5'-phosphate reductase
VVIHNSISIDGSLTGFEPNMPLHYKIVNSYKPELYLVGSNTVKTGIEMSGGAPAEEERDYQKPNKNADLSFWVIPDSKGLLKDMLHYCRRYEYCRDVIVLTSKKTSKEYHTYLQDHNFDYHIVGEDKVDLPLALDILSNKYSVNRIVADSGRILSNLVLEQNLASQISLLIHPTIVGNKAYNMFSNIKTPLKIKLVKKQVFPKGYIWIVYQI